MLDEVVARRHRYEPLTAIFNTTGHRERAVFVAAERRAAAVQDELNYRSVLAYSAYRVCWSLFVFHQDKIPRRVI